MRSTFLVLPTFERFERKSARDVQCCWKSCSLCGILRARGIFCTSVIQRKLYNTADS
jgi:hypothetical protein